MLAAAVLLLNMPVSLRAGLAADGGTTYAGTEEQPSAIGHRVTIAPEREPHRVTIGLSNPMYGAGAGVGAGAAASLGPYYNVHIQAGLGLVSFDIEVTGNPNNSPLVIPFTVTGGTEGTHYTLPFASPLIIPAGQRSTKLYIDFIAVSSWFAQRDIVVTLGSAVDGIPRGQQAYSFYLRPTATAPVVQWSGGQASGTEEGGPITKTITIASAVLDDVTAYLNLVSGGTASPTDYSTSTLSPVILAGDTSVVFTLTPVDDAAVEPNETVGFKIDNDARTTQVNLWTFSDSLNQTEGPNFGQGPDAGRPTDNEYVDDTVSPVGWSLIPVAGGKTPDSRLTGYRYVVTTLGLGDCKIGKSIDASSVDALGKTVGGYNQLIKLAAENVLSVYVRKPDVGFTARYFSLDIHDRIADVHHRARFTWSGTVPVVSSTENGVTAAIMTGQAWDHSLEANGWYRIRIEYSAPVEVRGNATMRYLEAFTAATGEDTDVNRFKGVEFAWPQFEQAGTSPTAYQRCIGSHWSPWGGATVGATDTCTFTINNTDV